MGKNVIVYLSRSEESNIRQMIHSIHLLDRNFLPWSPADILVFHEAGFDKSLILADEIAAKHGVKFAEVDFSAIHPGMEDLSKGQRGYRHMCHFFANDIFLREELSQYDYYMRLDVDSYILNKIPFDIFGKMKKDGLKYVYRMVMTEHSKVAVGLKDLALDFFAKNPDLNKAAPRIKKLRLFYTNFEICDMAFFRGSTWQRYFAAIDARGGIWRHRWGDAPIRWIGLKHLLMPSEMYCLKAMTYFHQFKICKGFASRLPWDFAKYLLSVFSEDLKTAIAKRRKVKSS